MPLKVAIVGTVPTSRNLAPYADPEWEIWTCSAGNSQAQALPRVTKWFEIHSIVDMTGEENRAWSLPFYEWLKQQEFPVYMQEKNDYVPNATVFPYKRMIEMFGRAWFTSSVAWMLAFAISQMSEGDEIGIFGVDMAADQEHHTFQKPGCIRFIEIAKERGIKVSIPMESCLGQLPPLYGYAESTIFGRRTAVRLLEMEVKLAQVDQQLAQLNQQRHYFAGAIEDCRYMMRTFTDGEGADLDDEVMAGADKAVNAAGQFSGMKVVPLSGAYEQSDSGLFVPPGTPKAQLNGGGPKHISMELEPGKFEAEGAAAEG